MTETPYDRYSYPEEGEPNWNRDEGPENIWEQQEIEIAGEVEQYIDLPEPDPGAETDDGQRRTYLVTSRKTIYRDTGSEWEAVAGIGDGANPLPGTSHFERAQVHEEPTEDADVVRWTDLDGLGEGVVSNPMTENLDADGEYTVTNLRGPEANGDAATREFVLDNAGGDGEGDVSNPMAEDLDAGGHNIEDVGSLHTDEVTTETKPWADVTAYGATGDGVTDDTQAFKDTLAAAKRIFVPETDDHYLITDTLPIERHLIEGASEDVTLHCDLSNSTATTGMIVTGPATIRDITIRSDRSTWNMNEPWSGVEIQWHNVTTNGLNIREFEYGLHLHADGRGVGYGDFTIGSIFNSVEGIRFEAHNNGWVNENTFTTARIQITSTRRDEADALSETAYGVNFVNSTSNMMNSNKFIGVSVEHTDVGVRCTGEYNTFMGQRCESMHGSDNMGIAFQQTDNEDLPEPRYNNVIGYYGPTRSTTTTAGQIRYVTRNGVIVDDLRGNFVIARQAEFNPSRGINLHGSGFRSATVTYDADSREFVFESQGTEVARLHGTNGDLRIAGSITENASF